LNSTARLHQADKDQHSSKLRSPEEEVSMRIFKSKSHYAETEVLEASLYEQVQYEISYNKGDRRIWERATADSNGDRAVAKQLYIQYRVGELKHRIRSGEETKQDSAVLAGVIIGTIILVITIATLP